MTGLPLGRPLRQLIEATRAADRARPPARSRDGVPRAALLAVPHPRRLRVAGRLLWLYRAHGLQRLVRRERPAASERLPPRLEALDAAAPPLRQRAAAAARARPAQRRAPRARRRCSPAACSASSSPTSTRRRCACWPPRAARWSSRAGRAAAARSRARRARGRGATLARRLIDAFEAQPVDVDRGQRRRLRLDDQGVRRPAAPTTRPGPSARAAFAAQGARRDRVPRRAGAARRRATRSAHASPTTTPATWRTRRASARQPRALLRAIPGLELVEIPDGDQCCGSAGHLQPARAGERPTRSASARRTTCSPTGAQLAGQPPTPAARCRSRSCCARAARRCRPAHPIEILDAAIRGVPLQCLGGGIGIMPGKTYACSSAMTPITAAPATECQKTVRKIGPSAWARSFGCRSRPRTRP